MALDYTFHLLLNSSSFTGLRVPQNQNQSKSFRSALFSFPLKRLPLDPLYSRGFFQLRPSLLIPTDQPSRLRVCFSKPPPWGRSEQTRPQSFSSPLYEIYAGTVPPPAAVRTYQPCPISALFSQLSLFFLPGASFLSCYAFPSPMFVRSLRITGAEQTPPVVKFFPDRALPLSCSSSGLLSSAPSPLHRKPLAKAALKN